MQQPNIKLATKTQEDGWFFYQCKKQETKVQNEALLAELAHSNNNSKTMASGKNPTKSAKDLHRHSNHVVGSNEWAQ